MPRTARTESRSRIYHVMMRGVNRQQLFFDEEDNLYFIRVLDRFRKPCDYRLYAYCLMGNHVHLLLREGEVSLGNVFRHVNGAYAYWYNLKYERTGPVFQGRFRSEPVEDDLYFRTVFRYILQNPVKAGLCGSAEKYPYSSAGEYLLGQKGITDTDYAFSQMDQAVMREYICRENDDSCMDTGDSVRPRCTDSRAMELVLASFGTPTPVIRKTKERQDVEEQIRQLIRAGISVRQLSRLTGISRKQIDHALR